MAIVSSFITSNNRTKHTHQQLPRQSFVSVGQLRRNFDDGRPSAEGHPRSHNQPGSNPSYSVAICRRCFTLGPGGPRPQFVAGPQIFEGFPVFYHRHGDCDEMKRPRGQAPENFRARTAPGHNVCLMNCTFSRCQKRSALLPQSFARWAPLYFPNLIKIIYDLMLRMK